MVYNKILKVKYLKFNPSFNLFSLLIQMFARVSLLFEDGFFHLIKHVQDWTLFLVVQKETGLLFFLVEWLQHTHSILKLYNISLAPSSIFEVTTKVIFENAFWLSVRDAVTVWFYFLIALQLLPTRSIRD